MKTCLPILLSCWLFPVLGIAQHQAADLLRHYRQILPFEKLYLHTDQSVYEPGDNIWFRAYLTDDKLRPVFSMYNWTQVQLLDPQGQAIQTLNLSQRSAELFGAISLSPGLSGGVYTLRAATNRLFNFGKDAFYEKKILIQKTVTPRLRLKLELDRSKYQGGDRVVAQVEALNNDNKAIKGIELKGTPFLGDKVLENISVQTNTEGKATFVFQLPEQTPNVNGLFQVQLFYEGQNESIARSIHLIKEKIVLGIFPEGGDLVTGFQQKVAFKMMDTLGNPIDGKGSLFNSKHEAILSFESFHKGMGHFSFTPEANEKYSIQLTGYEDDFPLPTPRLDELALRIGLPTQDSLKVEIWKRNPGQAQVVLRSKDSIAWRQSLFLEAGETSLSIPVAKLPAGIAEVLVLNDRELPYAERLVFLNSHRQARLQIKTNKPNYLPNEEVILELEAQDETGKPLDGDFSLAVVNDLHWTMADDKQDNILSRLLMSAELKGKIDEPAFYFKLNEPKARLALDLVMLTHGWRKFSWKEIMAIDPTKSEQLIAYPEVIEIAGWLTWSLRRPAKPKALVWIRDQSGKLKVDSNEHFKFIIPTAELIYPLSIVAKSKGYRVEQLVYELPKPKFNWPVKEGSVLKSLNVAEIFAPKINPDVKVSPVFDEPTNVPVSLSGELNEVVVSGFTTMNSRTVTGAIVGYGNQDMQVGIGDNLFIGGLNSYYRGNSFDIELEPQPKENPDGNNQVYNRIFGNFPHHNNFTETQRRNTIYWAPLVLIHRGKGQVKFRHNSKTGTFRVIVEGVAQQALIGRAEATYVVQKIVELSAQMPQIAMSGDTLILEAKIKNRGHSAITGSIHLNLPSEALQLGNNKNWHQNISIPADSFVVLQFPLWVQSNKGKFPVNLSWLDELTFESWEQTLEVQIHGFQYEMAHSSQKAHVVFQIPVTGHTAGSLLAQFNAYTLVYQELVEGLAAIVREPHGCFEQVSSSNYPSIMALKVLKESGAVDFAFQKKALEHLHKGYKLLTGYQVPGGGFSVFGHAPAIERITAYGLLQFWDMRTVYSEVDMGMFEKNLDWLLGQKKKYNGAYAPDPLSHLFTLYALSEIRPELLGSDLLKFEEKHAENLANDPYLLAILLCANANFKAAEATQRLQLQLRELLKKQSPGNFKVQSTFGLSYGKNVQTETAAWVALAMCKAGQASSLEVAIMLDFLRSSRDYAGGFGSTQATVIALKALLAFQTQVNTSQEPGKIMVRVNKRWADTLSYAPKQMQKLQADLSRLLRPGMNEIEVIQQPANQAIPFLLQAAWSSNEVPQNHKNQVLALETQFSTTQPVQGEFVRLSVNVKNKLTRAVNAPMAIIGIPAGLSLQNWQLIEMEKKRLFDHFEIKDNYLIVYYESLPASAERSFHLDLRAEYPGTFQSPLSSTYPYYDAEQKTWKAGAAMRIRQSPN